MKKGKITILVVDDEPRYVWTIRVNLEARGYRVLVAEEGETALGLVASERPDLVLLDVRCLLYTSPSPRDRTRSRMPSSA